MRIVNKEERLSLLERFIDPELESLSPAEFELLKISSFQKLTNEEKKRLATGQCPPQWMYSNYATYDNLNDDYRRNTRNIIMSALRTYTPQIVVDVWSGSGRNTCRDMRRSGVMENIDTVYACDGVAAAEGEYERNLGYLGPDAPKLSFSHGSIDSITMHEEDISKQKLLLLRGGGIGNIPGATDRKQCIHNIIDMMSPGDHCLIDFFSRYVPSKKTSTLGSFVKKHLHEIFSHKRDSDIVDREENTLDLYSNKQYYANVLKQKGLSRHNPNISVVYDRDKHDVIVTFGIHNYQKHNQDLYPYYQYSMNAQIEQATGGKDIAIRSHRFTNQEMLSYCSDAGGHIESRILQDPKNPYMSVLYIAKK